ncbi:hypothetical protein [Tepidibacter hydrothermalis]|uniref:Uncharacterized protein n=1 Tax=Tepidibacter hydrothermalis TaxID=3036126 RepID=A0ABY8EJ06_9FIRM|nr:hypothetical protein [Tepidibacter hydrothermalis]WFD12010.1 hypothetical protein P4S50_08005 [Tepidibacter hydrothermalis]
MIDVKSIQENIIASITEVGAAEEVTIQRKQLDKYKQPMKESLEVCTLKGFYYAKNSYFNIHIDNGGTVNTGKREYLLIVLEEEGQKVQEGDFFERKGVKYKIADLGEIRGIINNMLLERI